MLVARALVGPLLLGGIVAAALTVERGWARPFDGLPPAQSASNSASEAKTSASPEEKAAKTKPEEETKDKENGEKKEEKEGKEKEEKEKEKPEEEPDRPYSIFGQTTVVSQWHGRFRSPYSGPNSLPDLGELATSETGTLFLGGRLWQGGAIYFNPEISGGRGFGGVVGIAGFPNGEITRVGKPEPTPYVARAWFTQVIGLGGPQEKVEAGPNQVAGYRDIARITLVVGKMAATDWFDLNRYSHDPRAQFLNWSLMDNGAWDYPADVRGYDYGGVVELNQADWAFRWGIFGEPTVANGPLIDPRFNEAHGQAIELEQRYQVFDRPGKARWLAYLNRADMGRYQVALEESPVNPDITRTRSYRSNKCGFGLNLEQELNDELGGFARLGWNDGHTESWAFTEIDRTIAFGFVLKGIRWCRAQDEAGLGIVFNGLSRDHREYLAAGGLGFLLGDGRLNYGVETIVETYYRLELKKDHIWVTPDFQVVDNPGYNRDRGPVAIGAIRVHAEF